MARRHHVPADLGRLALPGRRPGRPLAGGSWAGRWPTTCATNSSSTRSRWPAPPRPQHGLIHHSDAGSQYVSLGFGQAARDAGIAISMGSRATPTTTPCRELLRHAQERTRTAAPGKPNTSSAPPCSNNRSVLQPRAPTLNARHVLTRRVRAALRAARLRCAERGSPDHRHQVKKCRLNRGTPPRHNDRDRCAHDGRPNRLSRPNAEPHHQPPAENASTSDDCTRRPRLEQHP